jgi:hypothetical protein
VRTVVLTAVTISTLVLSACQRSESRYLEREVAATEVIGTWQMNPASVKDLRNAGYTAAIDPSRERIVINADGTCVFDTLPPHIVRLRRAVPKTAVECRWRLDKPPRQKLMIELVGNASPDYFFDETNEGHLVLWQYVTDPDAWRYVEYTKQ